MAWKAMAAFSEVLAKQYMAVVDGGRSSLQMMVYCQYMYDQVEL